MQDATRKYYFTANLLTLNSSKTEFLLIVLKQQLAKISSCSLDTAHSARNHGFIFDEHVSFFYRAAWNPDAV